jgi:aminoglycoside 2'-N-acetyltransferase I
LWVSSGLLAQCGGKLQRCANLRCHQPDLRVKGFRAIKRAARMTMRIELRPRSEGWKEVEPLFALVYPPHVLATIVWRDVTWAHADQWVLVYEEGPPVSATGMYLRNGLHDGVPAVIGGIGGVMTHPEFRGHGYASAALGHADAQFHSMGIEFSLLFCEPKNFPFYARLGWRVFAGDVIVEQPTGRGPFTVTTPMVQAVGKPAPLAGTIDLCGLPW